MTGPEALVHDALRRAAAWRLIGLLFERPRDGWWDEVSALATEVGDELLAQAVEEARGGDQRFYLHCLGPGGYASPRESAHRGRVDPGALLAELRGFYAAFAFAPPGDDPPDHVAVEAGFMSYLALKVAFGLANDLTAEAELTAAAADRFLAEHLRAFALPLRDRLATGGDSYLVTAAHAMVARTGPPEAEPYADPELEPNLICGLAGCAAVPEEDPSDVFGGFAPEVAAP